MKPFATVILLVAIAAAPAIAASQAEDKKLIAELRAKQKDFANRVIATADPEQRAALIREQTKTVDAILANLGEPTRSALAVSIKIVEPIQSMGANYLNQVGTVSQQGTFDFASIATREDIARRAKLIEDLERANAELLERISRVESDMDAELSRSALTAAQRRDFQAGFTRKFGQTVGPSKAIRNIDAQVWMLMKRILALLDSNWGNWKVREGTIVWDVAEAEVAYTKMQAEIDAAIERQSRAEQELARRI